MKFMKKKPQLPHRATEALLVTFTVLLESGFSLQESLQVLLRSRQFSEPVIEQLIVHLAQGQSFAAAVAPLSLSATEKSQLHLAENHGDLTATLRRMVDYHKLVNKQKQLLYKVAAYPLLLLVFLLAALFGMHRFLLPQLLASGMIDEGHWGIRAITWAPAVLILFLLLSVLLFVTSRWVFARRTALQKAVFFSRLPLFGALYTSYHTSFFALEWGKLFQQGLDIQQIIECMEQTSKATLIQELARELRVTLTLGGELPEKLRHFSFLTPEFSLIVFQGEVRGKLGEELFLYSQLLMERLFQRIEKAIHWVQPLIFLLVALMIVGIYAAMFLPIYGNIQGVIE